MSIRRRQIVLAGPPGAGKSTVARQIATTVGGTAIDLDEVIEAAAHRSCAEIISRDGEAHFRGLEAETLGNLGSSAAVLALGGGTLTAQAGRRLARARGPVIGLRASAQTLAARLEQEHVTRPLLERDGSSSLVERLRALLDERRSSYAMIDRHVSAEGSPEQTSREALEKARDLRILVSNFQDRQTRISIGHQMAEALLGAVRALEPTRPILVLSDLGIPAPRRQALLAPLLGELELVLVELDGGESVKSWDTLQSTIETALAGGCGRQSVVLGLGGGALCDLAALTASLLGRGAGLVLAPSTLLAQVDASVGGKCAINAEAGRNLVGAFFPADEVVMDLDLLESLEDRDRKSGMAEIAKMGIIADPALFRRLVQTKAADMDAIERAVELKAEIVAEDPLERDRRKLLNFGHTLGHALEASTNYTLRHGEAVSIGMAAAARLAADRGWAQSGDCDEMIAGLEALGLPVLADESALEGCLSYLRRDKKADSLGIDLICVPKLGEARWVRVSFEEIEAGLVRSGGHGR